MNRENCTRSVSLFAFRWMWSFAKAKHNIFRAYSWVPTSFYSLLFDTVICNRIINFLWRFLMMCLFSREHSWVLFIEILLETSIQIIRFPTFHVFIINTICFFVYHYFFLLLFSKLKMSKAMFGLLKKELQSK